MHTLQSKSKDYKEILHKVFHPALEERLPSYDIYDPITPNYVASVLTDFSENIVFKRIQNTIVNKGKEAGHIPGYIKTLEQLSVIHIQDMKRSSIDPKIIGDYALAMLGMFPGVFKRNKASLDEDLFFNEGSHQYSLAHKYFEKLYPIYDQFNILSNNLYNIVKAVRVCNENHWFSTANCFVIDPLLRKAVELIN